MGEWCLSRFLERMLSEVFTWRQHLPSWTDEVDGLASPLHLVTTHSRLPRGQGLPVRHRLVLLSTQVGNPHWYMFMEYRKVKRALTRWWLSPSKGGMLFRHVP
jgi:hypothetical protein